MAMRPVVKPSSSSIASAPSPFGARSFICESRRQRLRQPSCEAHKHWQEKTWAWDLMDLLGLSA